MDKEAKSRIIAVIIVIVLAAWSMLVVLGEPRRQAVHERQTVQQQTPRR